LLVVVVGAPTALAGRPGIIATVGPRSSSVPTLRGMIAAGARVARINLSHGDARSTARLVGAIREAARAERRTIPILFDLPGGKVRTGNLARPVALRLGQAFTLIVGGHGRVRTDATMTSIDRVDLPGRLDRVLLDDGRIELAVERVRGDRIETRVVRAGQLRGRTGVSIPGQEFQFPALLPRDRRRLAIAVSSGADYVGVSMVQSPRNLVAVRRALARLGAPGVKVVAKIESLSALANLDAIIDASDAVMIARGDLSMAVGAERLAEAQATIAARCVVKGKPFIAATNFMSNMLTQGAPSEANLMDVARARLQGPSWFMLNETAVSPYPVETVRALRRALD
jgi:pyruvate kinase